MAGLVFPAGSSVGAGVGVEQLISKLASNRKADIFFMKASGQEYNGISARAN